MKKFSVLFVMPLFLAACSPAAVEELAATAVPPTATTAIEIIAPTAVPTLPPTATAAPVQPAPTRPPTEPPPTATAVVVEEVAVEYGRTAAGAYFQGAANAPVTLIDYSDFL